MDVKDKVIIITGASSGIGEAAARMLHAKGAKVVLAARSRDKLEAIGKELSGSLVVVADMTKPEDIRRMVAETKKQFGRVDILINNAGVGYDAPIEKTSTETFRHVFELDVIGPLVAMQEVIPLMCSQGGGLIMNVSSGTALMALPNMGAYSSAKRALVGLSLTAREELKKDKIIVNVIYPYITYTDFEKNTIKEEEHEWPAGGNMPKGDTAEYIAEKILAGIGSEEAEIYAHDWMGKPRG